MIKELPPIVMEPFSEAELTALDEKLASLSLLQLKSYIDSTKSSLQNQALASTWRSRVEIGRQHAEAALVRAQEAALGAGLQTTDAAAEAAPPVVAVAKKAKATKAAKAEVAAP